MKTINKIAGIIFLIVLVTSCGQNNTNNFTLKGKVKGLKKGVLYLQKDSDSTLVNLDSVVISGQPEFVLQTNIKEPILLYLKLFKNDGEEHFIPFFASEGVTEITSTLKNFSFDVDIKGSEQQKLLEDYLDVMGRFNDENLDLIEAKFLAYKNSDSTLIDSLNKRTEALLKRKYTYTIQYALNHNDSEVSPYLAYYEIPNANPIFIDSIYNGLTDRIKKSFYGIKLEKSIRLKQSEQPDGTE
jgi:hypothetical protein